MKLMKLSVLATSLLMVACGGKTEIPGESTTVQVGEEEMTMVLVNPAQFKMGGTPEQTECDYFTEKPAHDVKITKAYYISQTEVTQELWQTVMGSNPSMYKNPDEKNLPVTNVTWYDCQKFVKALSEKTGKTFRLPTEAEWEYAARGAGHGFNLPYAGSKYCDRIACMATNSEGRPHPVAQFGANEAGLYDMSGNVWEWVADNFLEYKDSLYTDPLIVTNDTLPHSVRGGSFTDRKSKCRTSTRMQVAPDFKQTNLGLRVVMEK